MNITLNVEAPELANAISALAVALSGNKVILPAAASSQKEEAPKKEAVKVEKQEEKAEEKETSSAGEDKPSITLETVRGKLAALSQSGKQAQVKELISSFGVKKLTAIPEEKYAELLEKAEAI